jgi:hypothetical protein
MAYGVFKRGAYGTQNYKQDNTFTVLPARVLSVVLDSKTYPATYKQHGDYASLGGITFEFLSTPKLNKVEGGTLFALPLLPNIHHYPIEGEIVTIVLSGGINNNQNTLNKTFYYLPPTNTWASTHINAVPNEIYTPPYSPTSTQKSYLDSEAGSPNVLPDTYQSVLPFKYGIKERSDIRPLLPQPGDVSFEGRWGQSIRLGSTNRSALVNTWSTSGTEGDPLIIIRNNQFKSTVEPWIPLSEDINADGGSIYISSTQKIPINTVNYKIESFNSENPPTEPKEYIKDQIILNSGRLLFAAKEDSILLTSANSIHLSATRFNVDVDSTTIQSNKIELGSSDPSLLQPVLRGQEVQDLLDNVIELLTKLTTACLTASNGAGPVESLVTFALENQALLAKLKTSTIKSKDVFTV